MLSDNYTAIISRRRVSIGTAGESLGAIRGRNLHFFGDFHQFWTPMIAVSYFPLESVFITSLLGMLRKIKKTAS